MASLESPAPKFWNLENLDYCCTEKIEILLYSSDVLASVKSSKAHVVLRESLKWVVFKAQSRDCGATSLFHKSPTICIYGQMHSRPFIRCLYLSLYLLNAKLPLLFLLNVLYLYLSLNLSNLLPYRRCPCSQGSPYLKCVVFNLSSQLQCSWTNTYPQLSAHIRPNAKLPLLKLNWKRAF